MEKKLYEKRFSESAEYRKKVWQVLIDNWFSKWIPDNVTILDLGCGWGEFINQIAAKKKYAIDLNADAKNI
ncbi:MAG: class I SAM-dependent methyltransferase [Deltaproteobacteria bacterium]